MTTQHKPKWLKPGPRAALEGIAWALALAALWVWGLPLISAMIGAR